MGGSKIIIALALVVFVVALPIYIVMEPERMVQAQEELRQDFVSDAAVLYVENCAVCHGAAGEGIGSMPSLDSQSLRTADYDFLYKTIARGRYGTTMAGWHSDEGGVFNSYQIDELVALVRYVDWSQVNGLAAEQGLIPPTLPVPEVGEELVQEIIALSPEGSIWAEGIQLYANNCTICHGIDGKGTEIGTMLNSPDVREKEKEELYHTISEGVPGTMMTGWVNALEPAEIESLVSFLLNWDVIEGEGLHLSPPEPVHVDLDNPEEVLALGERLFSTTCSACHGENGSGGTGPALNSLQVLTNKTDEQIANTIIQGGHRPNSTMPAFGDRMTSIEIDALVDYIRSWESTATWVENPRGTQQGGGPPWLRATPDANNLLSPETDGNGGRGGGPPWRTGDTASPAGVPVFPVSLCCF